MCDGFLKIVSTVQLNISGELAFPSNYFKLLCIGATDPSYNQLLSYAYYLSGAELLDNISIVIVHNASDISYLKGKHFHMKLTRQTIS